MVFYLYQYTPFAFYERPRYRLNGVSMEAYMDLQLSSCFYFSYTYEVGLMPK